MNIQQIDKSIKQMRQMFGLFAVLELVSTLYFLSLSFQSGEAFLWAFLMGIFSFCFSRAYSGLGKRDKNGYNFARVCSVIFLLSFPVLTYFGVSYLIKLAKPEVKQAFGLSVD